MPSPLSVEEAAHRAGVTSDDLRYWQRLGLVRSGERLEGDDVERTGLIRFAVGRGFAPEKLAELSASQGDMIGAFVESIRPYRGDRIYTIEQAASEAGIGLELFRRVWAAAGRAEQRMASDDDVQAFAMLNTALAGGIPEDVFAQILRVFSDSLGKVADACVRLFHLYVHEQLRSGGAGGAELLDATNAISSPLLELVEPAVLYFNRKAWEQAFREDMMLHLAEEATGPASTPGQFWRTVLFVDLSSFTPLTQAMGDTAAAKVIDRFSELVRAAAAQCSGQVVKQIGDEFMLVFPDGRLAVTCGLAIRAAAAAEPQFPALRIGAHSGAVLYREGDYVGTNVNIAARVTAAATRHQFLVTEAVLAEIESLDVDLTTTTGSHSLKGLNERFKLYQVRDRGPVPAKTVDPVCGMDLDADSSEAELNWLERRLQFCSTDCLQLFLATPDRYATPQPGGM